MTRHKTNGSRTNRPVENRDVLVVAGRIVRVRTQHVGDALWIATGTVSEPLPSGPQLESPIEVTATGSSETKAIDGLKRRIEEFDHRIGD